MKLIVGLGNPGKEYDKTRHNVGFMALDHYLKNASFKGKDNYEYYETTIDNEKIIFLKPLTYMNDSGLAIRKVMDYYNIDIKDLLVIHDDMDFEVGKYKLKANGSSAGHNGIKSIISHLNTSEFNRLRIGISKPIGNPIDYVLGRFSKSDLDTLNNLFEIVDNIIEDFIKLDYEKLMSKYNSLGEK